MLSMELLLSACVQGSTQLWPVNLQRLNSLNLCYVEVPLTPVAMCGGVQVHTE